MKEGTKRRPYKYGGIYLQKANDESRHKSSLKRKRRGLILFAAFADVQNGV